MTRRRLILAAAVAAALPLHPAAQAARVMPPEQASASPRRLRLRHAATGACFAGTYHTGRALDPAAMAELSFVLADSHTGAVRPFDPAAIDILWEVASRTRLDGEIVILSGYRTRATNRAVNGADDSQHLRAGAVDVQLASARLGAFGEAALALGRGGVGLYRRRGFVHLDSGPVRRWGEADLPGRPSNRLGRIAEAWAATRGR